LEQIFWAGIGLLIYTTLLVKREEKEIQFRKEEAGVSAEASAERAIRKEVDV
jgi:hypothetical protein